MATSVGDIALNLKLDKKPYEKGLADVKSSAGRIGSGIGKTLAVGIASALGTVVATAGLKSLISQARQLGDTIDKASQKMGMSTQAYQEWGYVMERCGTSIDSMTMGMKTLASSAETSKDAFAELGITQAEIASMSQEQLFARTISALQNVEDTTKRTYLAGQLLGRGATELGALLNMSAKDTENLRQNLYNLGGAMSQEAVTNSAQLTDALTDIKMAFRGVSNIIAENVLPVITSAINSFIIPAIQKAINVLRYFVNIWNSVFGAIRKGASAVGKMFGKVGSGFKSVFGKAQAKMSDKTAKAVDGVGKSVGGAGKKAKKAKKAIKELNRELMGFDKMNKLAKQDKANAGGGAGGGGGGGGAGDIGGVDDALGGVDSKLFDMSKLTQKLAPLWKALGDIFKAVLRLIRALAKAFAPVGKFIWKHLIKPFLKLIGMGVIAVLEGIAGAIELLALFVEKHPKLTVVLTGIATALFLVVTKGAGAPKLFTALGKAFGVVGKAIMAHPIVAIITGIALAIGYVYKNWDKIKKTKFGKFLIKIGTALKKMGKAVKTWAVDKFKAVKPILTAVGKIFKKLGGTYIKTLASYFKSLGKALEGGRKVFKKVGGYLKGTFKGAIQKATKPIKTLKNIWEGIKSKKPKLKVSLSGTTAKTFKKFKGYFDAIKGKTAELKVKLSSVIAKGYNTARKKINGFLDKLPKAIQPKWRLPALAQGGWVGKNTPQLAVVGDNRHEGEIVAPESKMMAMAKKVAQESGGTDPQVVALLTQLLRAVNGLDTNVYLDGQSIADNTVRRINQQTRTTGMSPLLV